MSAKFHVLPLQIHLNQHRKRKAEQQQFQRQHTHGAPGGVVPQKAAHGTKQRTCKLAFIHGHSQTQRQNEQRLCLPQLEQAGGRLQCRAHKQCHRVADPFQDLAAAAHAA